MTSHEKVQLDIYQREHAKLLDRYCAIVDELEIKGVRSSGELRIAKYQMEANMKKITRLEIKELRPSRKDSNFATELQRRQENYDLSAKAIASLEEEAAGTTNLYDLEGINFRIGREKMRNGSLFLSLSRYEAKRKEVASKAPSNFSPMPSDSLESMKKQMGLSGNNTRAVPTSSDFDMSAVYRAASPAADVNDSIDFGEFDMNTTEE